MKVLTYRAIIEKDGKQYHGYIPALPGCHTSGKTIEETEENLGEAMKGWIETMKAHHESIPQDTSLEIIKTISVSEDTQLVTSL